MTKKDIINKWLPIFKYETMLTTQTTQFIEDIENNNLSIDEIIHEINNLCE